MASAPNFGETLPPTGRRDHRRARLCLPAQIETTTERQTGRITSLSRSGACVRLQAVPKVGHDVVVKCGAIDAFGIVVWSGTDGCGIRFDELLSDEVVVAARRFSDNRPELVQAQRVAAAQAWVEGRRA